jgi:hypothetical protein
MIDRSRALRASFDWRHGYVKIKDMATGKKQYHAILWEGSNMRASKQSFDTAVKASEYGHEIRRRFRGTLEKEENDDLHESDSD